MKKFPLDTTLCSRLQVDIVEDNWLDENTVVGERKHRARLILMRPPRTFSRPTLVRLECIVSLNKKFWFMYLLPKPAPIPQPIPTPKPQPPPMPSPRMPKFPPARKLDASLPSHRMA